MHKFRLPRRPSSMMSPGSKIRWGEIWMFLSSPFLLILPLCRAQTLAHSLAKIPQWFLDCQSLIFHESRLVAESRPSLRNQPSLWLAHAKSISFHWRTTAHQMFPGVTYTFLLQNRQDTCFDLLSRELAQSADKVVYGLIFPRKAILSVAIRFANSGTTPPLNGVRLLRGRVFCWVQLDCNPISTRTSRSMFRWPELVPLRTTPLSLHYQSSRLSRW